MDEIFVRMTERMIKSIESAGSNRSEMCRKIAAAIVEAYNRKDPAPAAIAIEYARRSQSRKKIPLRRFKLKWTRVSIRMQPDLIRDIEAIIGGQGLDVADFVRGAVIGFAKENAFDSDAGEN